jgi:hypothetical protein
MVAVLNAGRNTTQSLSRFAAVGLYAHIQRLLCIQISSRWSLILMGEERNNTALQAAGGGLVCI